MSTIVETLGNLVTANEAEQAALQVAVNMAKAKDDADNAVTAALAAQAKAAADLQSALGALREADAAKAALVAELNVESPAPADPVSQPPSTDAPEAPAVITDQSSSPASTVIDPAQAAAGVGG